MSQKTAKRNLTNELTQYCKENGLKLAEMVTILHAKMESDGLTDIQAFDALIEENTPKEETLGYFSDEVLKSDNEFLKYDEHGELIVTFEKPVEEIEVKTIKSTFGISPYLLLPEGQLNIGSKRLRRSLKAVEIKSYPCLIKIVRSGEKFQTQYKASIFETN